MTAGSSLLQDANQTFVVAPFWTDNDLSQAGRVRYEVYGDSVSTSAGEQERLDLIGQTIANQTEDGGGGGDGFAASWMMLVEWEECRPFIPLNTVTTILPNQVRMRASQWSFKQDNQ